MNIIQMEKRWTYNQLFFYHGLLNAVIIIYYSIGNYHNDSHCRPRPPLHPSRQQFDKITNRLRFYTHRTS